MTRGALCDVAGAESAGNAAAKSPSGAIGSRCATICGSDGEGIVEVKAI